MKSYSIFILILSFFLYSFSSSQEVCCRMRSALVLGDKEKALEEYVTYKDLFVKDEAFIRQSFSVLSKTGDINSWLDLFSRFKKEFTVKENVIRDVLEEFCWDLLQVAKEHDSSFVRLLGVIVSGMAPDTRSFSILKSALNDDNLYVKALAIKIASNAGYKFLEDDLLRLFEEEKYLSVRKELYSTLEKRKLIKWQDFLIKSLTKKNILKEERKMILKTLISMQEKPSEKDLEDFSFSTSKDIRLMAASFIRKYILKENSKLLLSLVQDPNEEVQIEALRAIGSLGKDCFLSHPILKEELYRLLREGSSSFSTYFAARNLLVFGDLLGKDFFSEKLSSSDCDERLLAAKFLTISGVNALPLIKDFLEKETNVYVKTQLAIALLLHRENCDMAWSILDSFLMRFFEVTTGKIPLFIPSDDFLDMSFFYSIENRTLALRMINLLAVSGYPYVKNLIHCYITSSCKEGFGFFVSLYLEEGLEGFQEIVKLLVEDEITNIKLEGVITASLIPGENKKEQLYELYKKGDWKTKMMILETFTFLKSSENTSFLLECCKEPMMSLRIAAAGALLLSLR